MKKYLLLLPVLLFLFSCEDYEKQINDLKASNDSLVRVNINRDSSINDFLSAFNEIENNISQIKEKEQLLTMEAVKGVENKEKRIDRINNDILQIYELLQSNKQKLKDLQKQLNRSNFKIVELQKTISRLETQMAEKDSAIAILRSTLKSKDLIIDSLYENIDSLYFYAAVKDEIISHQKDELNTAYFVIGSKKDLIKNGILDKKGGFVGINRILQLKQDFNKEYFTKIYINELSSIPLFVKEVEIVTNHPSESYQLVDNEGHYDSLQITDAKKFWSISKYLVIIVDKPFSMEKPDAEQEPEI